MSVQRTTVVYDADLHDTHPVLFAGPAAELLHLRALALCTRLGTNLVTYAQLQRLTWDYDEIDPEDLAAPSLVTAGLWAKVPDGFEVVA